MYMYMVLCMYKQTKTYLYAILKCTKHIEGGDG